MAARRQSPDVALRPEHSRPVHTELALCSGTGMLSEGLRAGLDLLGIDHRTVCHVERESYATALLVARMEDAALEPAPVWDDLTTFDGRAWRGCVDWVTAGFPCQPWSHAGKREGTADERWLWPAIVRIIAEVEPGGVFLENVPGLVSGGGLEYVLCDLAEMGFDAEWGHLSASAVGASHRRERVFIVGYAANQRCQWPQFGSEHGGPRQARHRRDTSESVAGSGRDTAESVAGSGGQLAHAELLELERWRNAGDLACESRRDQVQGNQRQRSRDAAGDSDEPLGHTERDGGRIDQPGRRSHRGGVAGQLEHAIGNGRTAGNVTVQRSGDQPAGGQANDAGEGCSVLADAQQPGPQGHGHADAQRRSVALPCDRNWGVFAPGPGSPLWREIMRDQPHLAPAIEPGVRVLADGIPVAVVDASRADQLRCSGNGVVPLQAAAAFVELFRRIIKQQLKGLTP